MQCGIDMSTNCVSRIAAAILSGALALPAAGEEKPLWEIGLGAGAVSFPEYRGSGRQRGHILPIPYFVYRGEILKADRGGVRGVFFDNDWMELNLSLAASPPVDSDSKGLRRGMPDLKPTVEFGPSLQFNLWRGEARASRLDIRLPLRAAYTVRGGVEYAGIVFSPAVNYDAPFPWHAGWRLGMLAGPIFANARQHEYFYSVAPRHALPDRPAYRASGGYSGTQFIASLSRRFERCWVGGFARYDTLAGAAFIDSPLVERKHSWAAGVAVTWMIGESSRTVSKGD